MLLFTSLIVVLANYYDLRCLMIVIDKESRVFVKKNAVSQRHYRTNDNIRYKVACIKNDDFSTE